MTRSNGGRGGLSPVEASERLGLPMSSASYHFRVLAETGALEEVGSRQVRGSIQHFYRRADTVFRAPWVESVLAETAATD